VVLEVVVVNAGVNDPGGEKASVGTKGVLTTAKANAYADRTVCILDVLILICRNLASYGYEYEYG